MTILIHGYIIDIQYVYKKEGEKIMAVKSLSIRIDERMLEKLHVLADYEGRSANSQILVLIRDAVEAYEEKYGEIRTEKE